MKSLLKKACLFIGFTLSSQTVYAMREIRDSAIKKSLFHDLCNMALSGGSISQYKNIINRGADINYNAYCGLTPLIAAVTFNRLYMVNELIDRGVMLDFPNGKGETALIVAADYGFENILKKLIHAGANIYLADETGNTALIKVVASSKENKSIKLNIIRAILDAAIFSKAESASIMNWLLVNERLRSEERKFLPKDLRVLVARNIYQMPSGNELRERVIHAGGLKALRLAKGCKLPEIVELLQKYLDPAFLENRLRSMLPPMLH